MLDLNIGQNRRRTTRRLLVVASTTAVLAACSSVQPFKYTALHEIQPGPGLISGKDGVFVLYNGNETGSAE